MIKALYLQMLKQVQHDIFPNLFRDLLKRSYNYSTRFINAI